MSEKIDTVVFLFCVPVPKITKKKEKEKEEKERRVARREQSTSLHPLLFVQARRVKIFEAILENVTVWSG